MPTFGACLFLLAAILGLGLVGFALTAAICLALRDFVPDMVLIVGVGPLWCVCTLGVAWLVGRVLRAKEEKAGRQFLQRGELDDETFRGLFDAEVASIALTVRREIGGRIKKEDVTRRLLPSDPIRQTCWLMLIEIDDLDWVELLMKLEGRFGLSLPDTLLPDATLSELVNCLARRPARQA